MLCSMSTPGALCPMTLFGRSNTEDSKDKGEVLEASSTRYPFSCPVIIRKSTQKSQVLVGVYLFKP
jgi:hypothetical protein